MAETFGWTLEYIRSLRLSDMHEWLTIKDARSKANAEQARREHFKDSVKHGQTNSQPVR